VAGKAFALLGPTASGKSHLAIEIAERAPVEIVSMDSAQVYRGLDIGTAKPSAEERRRVPHHLVDLLDADRSYSTGRWRADAIAAIRQILAKGRVPLIVGGTMLYYRALVGGLDVLPQADPGVRAEIDADAAARGWPALHAELDRVDPKSARRISPGDTQRILRPPTPCGRNRSSNQMLICTNFAPITPTSGSLAAQSRSKLIVVRRTTSKSPIA